METYKLTYQIGKRKGVIIKNSISNLIKRCAYLKRTYGRMVVFL